MAIRLEIRDGGAVLLSHRLVSCRAILGANMFKRACGMRAANLPSTALAVVLALGWGALSCDGHHLHAEYDNELDDAVYD